MRKSKNMFLLFFITTLLVSCSENYSNGERIGLITKFSHRGLIWKSWEGHLNVTQTGMNSSEGFDFSIDRDNEDQNIISLIDSCANLGWKVKLVYHQATGKNWFRRRGETSYFIDEVIILDKSVANMNNILDTNNQVIQGKVIDTIYVVITPDNPDYKKFFK